MAETKYKVTTSQRVTDRSLKRLSMNLPPGVKSLQVEKDGSLEASIDDEGLVYATLMPRLRAYGVNIDSVDEVETKVETRVKAAPKRKPKAKPKAKSTSRRRRD